MYVENNEGQIVDIDTGEIIKISDIKDAKQQKLIETVYKLESELNELGTQSDYKIIKVNGEKSVCVPIKLKHTFGKVFRVTLKEIMKSGILSKNARLFIGTFEPFIYFPTNSIIVDEGTPTVKDLEEIIGLKKSMVQSALRELEKEEIIKRVKRNGQSIIYFNPFLYCAGAYVLQSTYELFKNSKYKVE